MYLTRNVTFKVANACLWRPVRFIRDKSEHDAARQFKVDDKFASVFYGRSFPQAKLVELFDMERVSRIPWREEVKFIAMSC